MAFIDPSLLRLAEHKRYEREPDGESNRQVERSPVRRHEATPRGLSNFSFHSCAVVLIDLPQILHKSVHTAELRRNGKRTDWKEPYLLYENRFGTRG